MSGIVSQAFAEPPEKRQKTDEPSEPSAVSSKFKGQTPRYEQTMCLALGNTRLTAIRRKEVSTFIPNSQFMFEVIFTMDKILGSSNIWTQELQSWSPLHTRLYYGTLFYIQTMRAMAACTDLDEENMVFLDYLLSQFPPESLPVAGPLVPFFKSLCSCDPPFPEFGPVCPTLGNTTRIERGEFPCLPVSKRIFLPNLVGIRHGILNMRRPLVNNVPISWDISFQTTDAAANAILGLGADHHMNRDARIMPGTIRPVIMDLKARRRYALYDNHFRVSGAPNILHLNNYRSYLGFAGDRAWFAELVRQMKKHATHFRGSTTLASCSPRNGPSSLIMVNHEANYFADGLHLARGIRSIDLTASALCDYIELPSPSEPIGLATQINWLPADRLQPGINADAYRATKVGPIWTVLPTRSETPVYDAQPRLHSVIWDHFFIEKGEL